MEKITQYLLKSKVISNEVLAWEEEVPLPTYQIDEAEKNPIFLEKRVYQGSSGVVYPYPVIERISDEKADKPYRAVFIENKYLKIMILPELGGRLQMAWDKVNQRHFVYYNQVIKPALVGLTGPWISGGIEFNWPQHHRPSTFLPMEYFIERHDDGSCTVWCSEIERMFRLKGMHGFRIRPKEAIIEIEVKIYNRTPVPQTFLWWANPAVAVNDHYHSVFPPDVHAVFDHGKRDVSSFPIAKGVYYKQDYSAGVDISKYKNIPVPTSYMAIRSDYDFVGGYNADEEAGLLHVANHHISPGKKQWTWGHGDFGSAWYRNLTDEDGPYIELMTGVYTDNQPDFTWLQPYEEKSWVQYFMPYSKVGYVKNASRRAMLNLEIHKNYVDVIVYTTSEVENARIRLSAANGEQLLDASVTISPEQPYKTRVAVREATHKQYSVEVRDSAGKLLVEWKTETKNDKPLPDPARAVQLPSEIPFNEQLYLTGLHLEQYRHATYRPEDYYAEGLLRDPGDTRCNNAMGLLMIRRGQFDEAEKYFRKAIATLTERNPNPYDGEAYYNLGLSLQLQGKPEAACEAFYKSVWNAAWQDPGYFSLARIEAAKGNLTGAIELANRSLSRNSSNHKTRHLICMLLRKTGKRDEAFRKAEESLELDRFNMGCIYEKFLLTGEVHWRDQLNTMLDGRPESYLEYSMDYLQAGFFEEASGLIGLYPALAQNEPGEVNPMLYYALGYVFSLQGKNDAALREYVLAEKQQGDYCFPNRIEDVLILQDAISKNPSGSRAPYYLGNFWYSRKQYEKAITCWENSAKLNDRFPTVWRNLALAFYNRLKDPVKAVESIEKAFSLNRQDARILMEMDQLRKRIRIAPSERLNLLESYPAALEKRDDLAIEQITLYNLLGDYEKAIDLMRNRQFHPWEGGEGKITAQYILARRELARKEMAQGRFEKAMQLLNECDRLPENLGEGKLSTLIENDLNYYKGMALLGMNKTEEAAGYFRRATGGSPEPEPAFFYNDPQPDNIYYQGLAWKQLGNEKAAQRSFSNLIDYGLKHMDDHCRIDYFAVSLPDLAIWDQDLDERNKIHCNYVTGLGYLGMNNFEKAARYLEQVLKMDPSHQGAKVHAAMCRDHQGSKHRNPATHF
ncbi:MAG: DUF5107 domain-containing protein [Bacteroidales bacterium]|nr:DUF5107 domain-containing protein [Bacteroidales bacterium]MBN2698760.1 DUF5107 domain-containing protein [Bacteroidales bacterium]